LLTDCPLRQGTALKNGSGKKMTQIFLTKNQTYLLVNFMVHFLTALRCDLIVSQMLFFEKYHYAVK
jgi:hypothetical protein